MLWCSLMKQPVINLPDLPELTLLSFTVPDFGWEADLASLPEEAVTEIQTLLAPRLETDQIERLLLGLRRVFNNAIKIAGMVCQLQKEAEVLATVKGMPSRPPRKIGVRWRTNLRTLRSQLEDADHPAFPVATSAVCQAIIGNEPLERLVTLFLEERMRLSVINPLLMAPELAVAHLPSVLAAMEEAVDRALTRGQSEPVLSYLASGFIAHYRYVTGSLPGRTYDAYSGAEGGIGLGICRILAREMNASLPAGHRRQPAPDMTKPYRRALQEIKAAG